MVSSPELETLLNVGAQPLNDPVVLQDMVFPSIDLCTDVDLYFRCNDRAQYLFSDRRVLLHPFGKVVWDTYFNSFSIQKWLHHTTVREIGLQLWIKGSANVEFGHHNLNAHFRRVAASTVSGTESPVLVRIGDISQWEAGMLTVEIKGITECEIVAARFVALGAPAVRPTSLAIVVTSYNREKYLLPAVKRLARELLDQPDFEKRVSLLIVDNARSLAGKITPKANLRVIENPNVGGAGGFTRGLVEAMDDGHFTHCLFMDDDASCEIEAIKRAVRFLDVCVDSNSAVAGAMLLEHVPYLQYEAGGSFTPHDRYPLRPLKSGLDLRHVHALLVNELEDAQVNYAAWWFFMFPISGVKELAFPFFVRGDDFNFGIRNRFNIHTLNGIGTWQEDFSRKAGPMTEYLVFRSETVSMMMNGTRSNGLAVAWNFLVRTLNFANSYFYDRASGVVEAAGDVLKGPAFWEENADMTRRRQELLAGFKVEKAQPLNLSAVSHVHASIPPHESSIHRLIRMITLNGHLIPQFVLKTTPPALLPLWLHHQPRATFARRSVLFFQNHSGTGMVVRRDVRRYLNIMSRAVSVAARLVFTYPSLKASYQRNYAYLTSREFWDRQFQAGEKVESVVAAAEAAASSQQVVNREQRTAKDSLPPTEVVSELS